MQIRVTDKEGETAEETLKVIVPALAPPVLDLSSALVLNRQTGLFEQRITATNSGVRAVGGFTLSYEDLPDDVATWKVSPVPVVAGGTRVQWIDQGPPRTDQSPSSIPMRLYRVRELPLTP